jgi:hypothetical protein
MNLNFASRPKEDGTTTMGGRTTLLDTMFGELESAQGTLPAQPAHPPPLHLDGGAAAAGPGPGAGSQQQQPNFSAFLRTVNQDRVQRLAIGTPPFNLCLTKIEPSNS